MNTLEPKGLELEGEEEKSAVTVKVPACRAPEIDWTRTLNQIRKWGVHFDGKNPLAFLERANKLREAYGYSGEIMIARMPEVLRGDPLFWFRNGRSDWDMWETFCAVFKAKHLSPKYLRRLKRKVYDRVQKPGETFRQYATALLTLMRRAGRFSKQERVNLLHENGKPDVQLYI